MDRTNEGRIGREALAAFLAHGCKPAADWRIGTEHEKIGFCTDTLRPIPYEGERSIRALLESLATEGWALVYEHELPIALQRRGASITLEPGGQLELSGAPLASIHETCAEVADHLRLLRAITERLDIGFLELGFQPKWRREDIPWMPKGRYKVMRRYMPQVGRLGLDMMLRTATVQANLDFASEADMAAKVRVAACLQPLVTALFAASPFVDGRPCGYLSWRARCWEDTDPKRTGLPAMFFDDAFGFEDYVEWALDAPMYFVIRDGEYIDCAGQSFRDFLAGRLACLPGERPTTADWELHLGTLYPDVRLKQFIEVRGADAGPWPWICSLPALWKGLLYDAQTLAQAREWVADWTHDEVLALRHAVPKTALNTPFRDTTVLKLCETMLDMAAAGLARLDVRNENGESETIFLHPLVRAVASGKTQAEVWLEAWHGRWHQDISRLFAEAMHP